MLDQTQYNNLWTNTFGLPIQQIPCYYQYLQREVYFQDYLDLFSCPNSRSPTFVRVYINGYYTIDPGFDILHNPAYTVEQDKKVRLIVDYDFPYAGQLCKNREIKYILIGEAAPAPSIPLLNNNQEDISNTYFYNKTHVGSTNYFNAPLKAWGINKKTKENKDKSKTEILVELADKGVLLIDLSPFAVNYNEQMREKISQCLFKDLETRIQNLSYLNSKWDFCLIAPQKTSMGILNRVNEIHNRTIKHTNDLLSEPDYDITRKNLKVSSYQDYTVNKSQQFKTLKHLPKRAKLAVIIGGSPHYELIKRAF